MKKNITILCSNNAFQKAIAYSLSLKLDMMFVDINAILEFENTDLDDLIKLNGQKYYDQVERKTVASVKDYQNSVFVLDRFGLFAGENLKALKDTSVMIYLQMNNLTNEKLNQIYTPCNSDENFLNDSIFDERNKFFFSFADVIIKIDELSETQIVDKMVAELKNYFKEK